MKTVIVLVTLWIAIVAAYTSYERYQVFQLQPSSEDQLDLIQSLKQNDLFDFLSLSKMVGLPTTVMVSPDAQLFLTETLEEAGIPYTVIIEDLERYKVFQLQPSSEDQLDLIGSLKQNDSFDFWSLSKMVGLPTTVMVSPDAQLFLTETLEEGGIPYTVIIEDLESLIQEERKRQLLNPRVQESKISFNAYNRYETIQNYLKELAAQYPDIVSLEDIGTSYEGRKIPMIKIGTEAGNKPTILVDAGIHAREWISPAFALYLIRELLENEQNRNMIENVNWFIIPVLNPDGYEYTHTNERFWRKTRSLGSRCHGVDANRNFDFHWRETGASSYECDETYAGPSAFSESETSALRDTVKKYSDQIKLYLTFHSYGQYLLYPWGYTSNLPDNVDELDALARAVGAAIASVSGTRYTIGSSTNVLYAAAGGSDDWVKGVGGVELSYTIELPGGGVWGFDLPASKIMDVCIETFEGVKVYHNYTLSMHKRTKK